MNTKTCTVDVDELLNTWEDEIKNVNMYGGFWDWLDFRIRPKLEVLVEVGLIDEEENDEIYTYFKDCVEDEITRIDSKGDETLC